MYEKTLSKLTEILVEELGIDGGEVRPEAHLVNDLGVNSLEFMSVIVVIEDTFEIFLDENRLRDLKTVDDVVKYIVELREN